ncbi:MAG: ester cyclase [Thermomicrobiales bacterium]
MSSIADTAEAFFVACETGKGWQECQKYCHPDATFSAQAGALSEVRTVEQYTDWMRGLFTLLPDGSYDLKSFATDEQRHIVTAFAVFSGSHTGQGGPVPPTGKSTRSEYVYAMQFDGGKIRHMTKIWNDGFALKELGWA